MSIRRFANLPIALGFSLIPLLLAGCGEKIEAVCEKKCGEDAQICIEAGEKAEGTAEERGCESEFEAYVSCADEKGKCTSGVLVVESGCETEIKALDACTE